MKAFTLWQPWASLIAIGAKQFETRSWATPYRGPLIITASKRWTDEESYFMRQHEFRAAFQAAGIWSHMELPFGAAVCLVDLVDIYPTDDMPDISSSERAFGNYQHGRFAWKLANVRRFATPIPCRGEQGLWVWKGDPSEVTRQAE